MTVVIAGMPCSGKSSVARVLGKLGFVVVDLDEIVANKTGKEPGDFIRANGVSCFREVESFYLSEVLSLAPDFLSLGGGVLTVARNYESIIEVGAHLISLTASIGVLSSRAVKDEASSSSPPKRPLICCSASIDLGLIEVLVERWRFFSRAEVVLSTSDASPERVADSVVGLAENFRNGLFGFKFVRLLLPSGSDLNFFNSFSSARAPSSASDFCVVNTVEKFLDCFSPYVFFPCNDDSLRVGLDVPSILAELSGLVSAGVLSSPLLNRLFKGDSWFHGLVDVREVWPILEEIVDLRSG